MWCQYGLAECTKPANAILIEAAAAAQAVASPASLPSGWHEAADAAGVPPTAHHAPADTSKAAGRDDAITLQTLAAEADKPLADDDPPRPTAGSDAAEQAGAAPEARAATLPDGKEAEADPAAATVTDNGGGERILAALSKAEAEAAAEPAAVPTGVHAALPSTPAPLWPLLLGNLAALAAVAHLWRRLLRRRTLKPTVQQAAVQQTAPPTAAPQALAKDVEATAAPQPDAPALRLLACPPPGTAASAELSPLSSPASPGSLASPRPSAPPPLSVDPSVKARDAAKQGWVPVAAEPGSADSSSGQGRRKSEYHNPLYGSGGSAAASQAAGMGGQGEDGGSAAEWQAKAAVAAAGGRPHADDGEAADFRLLAAALPEPSSGLTAAWAGGMAEPAPASSAATSSRRRGPSGDLPSPGSPGKAPKPAPRKLTAARSVGPQELPPLPGSSEDGMEAVAEGDEEAVAAAHGTPAAAPSAEAAVGTTSASQATMGASLQAPASAAPHGGSAPTLRGVCLLTAGQFQVRRAGHIWAAPQPTQSFSTLRPALAASSPSALACLPLVPGQEQVRLGRLLGAGASACVYEAEWRGRQVAVKLAHPSTADPRSFARCATGVAGCALHLWVQEGARGLGLMR